MASFGLWVAACGPGAEGTSGATEAATSSSGGSTGTPTTSGVTSSGGESIGGSSSGIGDPTGGSTQAVDSMTDGTSSTGGTGSTGDTGSTGEPGDCVPTERIEITCDMIDNDCNGAIDDVDGGGDGICDCLNIAILGLPGYAPNANFESWLEDQGSTVTRTPLAGKPGVITPEFLAAYDLVLLDRIERALSPAEAAALEAFVKDDGRGMITLLGYNFDDNDPGPERDRANSALAPFGLGYQGEYIGIEDGGSIPSFDQEHPISMGIFEVNFWGGIAPVDDGNQGTSTIFAVLPTGNAGLAHQTAQGGRVIAWGDEWITFDSDWVGYADVQQFWANMVGWAKPQDFCAAPQ